VQGILLRSVADYWHDPVGVTLQQNPLAASRPPVFFVIILHSSKLNSDDNKKSRALRATGFC
jgi:hypothetical protein